MILTDLKDSVFRPATTLRTPTAIALHENITEGKTRRISAQ